MKRNFFILGLLVLMTVIMIVPPAVAEQYIVGGKELNVFGYATQSVQFGTSGDHHDTEKGLNQALMNIFIEGDYRPSEELRLYASGLFTVDWAYQIKHNDSSWNEKLFDKSKDKLNVDDEYWQILKELHYTWTPGDFFFRIGKQIVSWGEMDFIRLLDQINPVDDRRGFSDVEFETTIIPIWLLRAEYWPEVETSWLQELGFQFVFNPNADFIPNQDLTTGNDAGGIWSTNVVFFDPFAGMFLREGSPVTFIDEPDEWNPEGFEYGFRISALIKDTILTLNGFYGRANSPSMLNDVPPYYVLDPAFPPAWGVPLLTPGTDGISSMNFLYSGYYPRQKYVGVTWTADITSLQSSRLGGVSPVLRIEAMYEFDHVFEDVLFMTRYKSDYFRTGVGIDWKIKIPALNPRAYFGVSPQFLWDKITDYPSNDKLWWAEKEDTYTASLILWTSYLNGKLTPEIAWMYDITHQAHLFLPSITYSPSSTWSFKLEGGFINGKEPGYSLEPFDHKDYIAFKVKYTWG